MKYLPALLTGFCFLLTSCGLGHELPSEEQLQTTATYIAARILATQTARAPTITFTPEPTHIPTITATPVFDAVVNAALLKAFSEPKINNNPIYEFSIQDGLMIIGRNRDCSWIEVVTPLGDPGWVNTQLDRVSLETPCEFLPHGFWRPENGTVVFDRRTSQGNGELLIENGLEEDGYIILTDISEKPILGYFIHSTSEIHLMRIPDGEYYIYVSTGGMWDIVDYRFTENARYEKFQDPIGFNSTSTSYTTWSLTLHQVEGGSAAVDALSPDEFPKVTE